MNISFSEPRFSGTVRLPKMEELSYPAYDSRNSKAGLHWTNKMREEASAGRQAALHDIQSKLPEHFTLQFTQDPRVLQISFPVRNAIRGADRPGRWVNIQAYRDPKMSTKQWLQQILQELQPIARRGAFTPRAAYPFEPFWVDPAIIEADQTLYDTPGRSILPALTRYNALIATLQRHQERFRQDGIIITCRVRPRGGRIQRIFQPAAPMAFTLYRPGTGTEPQRMPEREFRAWLREFAPRRQPEPASGIYGMLVNTLSDRWYARNNPAT